MDQGSFLGSLTYSKRHTISIDIQLKVKNESCSVVSNSLWPHGLYSLWNSPGQNTGVDSCSLLEGIFPTQGSNSGLPHCRWILYQLSHQGSPRILEWVAYPFSSRSSQPKKQTGVSCIAGRLFICRKSKCRIFWYFCGPGFDIAYIIHQDTVLWP